jgi:membrane protein
VSAAKEPPEPRLVALAVFVVRVIARMRAIGLARTAASLSFTTLLALVPLATIAFGFASRFPVFEHWLETLEGFLLKHMLPASAQTLIHQYVREFTENAIGLTGVSLAFVAITAVVATATIEREINAIWGITRARPLGRRLAIYALGLTAGPVLVGASLSLTTWLITQSLAVLPSPSRVAAWLLEPIPFLFTTAALTLLYAAVPARKVAPRHALAGAMLAALAFEAAKHGFALYLRQVPTYRLVYGALAVLPVFLVWVYLCWIIVLAGAAVTATLEEPARARGTG